MKASRLLTLLCLPLFALSVSAQEEPQDAPSRLLVDSSSGKVVIVAGTEETQAGLAVAWTLRPNRKHAPVDWSHYKDTDGSMHLMEKFPVDDEHPANGDYLLVNGVLDLKTKGFTPLPSRAPYFPNKNHGGLEAEWSDEAHGTRYGVIANNGGGHYVERTLELWLVQIDAQGTHFTELTPAAEKAVRAYMRKRDPKDADGYAWKCNFGDDVFQGQKLSVHFDAETALEKDMDDGTIHFALPKGTVTGTTKK